MLALALSSDVQAIGLGEAAGQAIIGQPLYLEIPVLPGAGNLPDGTCFQVRHGFSEIHQEFALRRARVQLVRQQDVARLVLTADVIRDPVVNFSIAVGCGFEYVREYLILPNLSAAQTEALPVPAQTQLPQVHHLPQLPQLPQAPARPLLPSPEDAVLSIGSDTTLETLAGKKYPLQPKARQKFILMMLHANPVVAARDSLISAGSELQVPQGLPKRRTKPAPAAVAGKSDRRTPPTLPAAATSSAKMQDKLVIGAGVVAGAAGVDESEARIVADLELLIPVLKQQNQFQDALIRKLARLEGDYTRLQERFTRMEERVNRINADWMVEKNIPKSTNPDLLQLVIAAIAGGSIMALILLALQRWQARQHAAKGEQRSDERASLTQAASAAAPYAPYAAVPISPIPQNSIAPQLPSVSPPAATPAAATASDAAAAPQNCVVAQLLDFPLGALPSETPPNPPPAERLPALDFSVQQKVQTP